MSSPRALVVTSAGAEAGAVTSLLAALEVTGAQVRAIDVGRVGTRAGGPAARVLRAVVGELAARRLSTELSQTPPDVVVGLDPGAVRVLCAAREEAPRPFPVVAVVPELSPDAAWGDADADRFLCVDDHAAVALADCGVAGERVLPVGPLCEAAYATAGAQSRAGLRERFKMAAGKVVLVEVAGLGVEGSTQLALQLSLVKERPLYLFDAGRDADAAAALRHQVPTLDMRAKLFGATSADAPLLWRCADVVVARPTPRALARCLAVGARMVALDADGQGEVGRALSERGRGTPAGSALLVGSALEAQLAAPAAPAAAAVDGAGTAADAIWILGTERLAAVEERRAQLARVRQARVDSVAGAAARAAAATAPPGELEDIGGAAPEAGSGAKAPPPAPDPLEIRRLQAEIRMRRERAERTIADAQKGIADWEEKRSLAERHENADMARHAERNADLERARMHAALTDLAALEGEERRLAEAEANAASAARAPRPSPPPRAEAPPRAEPPPRSRPAPRRSVDDELEALKRAASSGGGARSRSAPPPPRSAQPPPADPVDDELEALKRKMSTARRKR